MDSTTELVETELPKITLGCCERFWKNKLLINTITDCMTKSIITTHINDLFIDIETYEDLKLACRKKTDEVGTIIIINDDIRKFMKELVDSVQACYNYNINLPMTYEDLYRKILISIYQLIDRLRYYVINDNFDNAKYNVFIEGEIHKCVKSMIENYIAMLYIKISDDEFDKTLVEINLGLNNKVSVPVAVISKYIKSKEKIEEKNDQMIKITSGGNNLKAKETSNIDDIEPPSERDPQNRDDSVKLKPNGNSDD